MNHEFFDNIEWGSLAALRILPPKELSVVQAPPDMKPLEDEKDDFADFVSYVAPPETAQAMKVNNSARDQRDSCATDCSRGSGHGPLGTNCALQ